MSKYFLLRTSFTLFILIFLFQMEVSAQDLSIRQYPENPKEGEEVKLTLSSDKYDLNRSSIVWSVNGEEVDTGVGRKTLTFKTSPTGSAQIVLVRVSQEGYNDAEIQTVVEANTDFLLYEGYGSYVPSFYKGRSLPAKEGTANVAYLSFANGEISGFSTENGNNYTWKVNGEEKKDLSGANKMINKIISKVTDEVLNISVFKEDFGGNIKNTELTIPLQKTEVVVYKTDELKQNKQPIENIEVAKKLYLLVEPFFFSVGSKKDKNLVYTWKVNDIKNDIVNPWGAVFSGKERDSVRINLDIINSKKLTEEASVGFTYKIE
jgi:hypothetical protein